MERKRGNYKKSKKVETQGLEKGKQNSKIPYQTKEDTISKSIIEQIENRRSRLTKEPKFRLILIGLTVILADLLFTTLILNLKHTNSNFALYSQIIIFQVGTAISLIIVGKLLIKPKEDEHLDDFLWKQGLAVFKLKIYLTLVLALWIPFLLLSNLPFFYNTFQVVTLILAPILYLAHFACVVLVSQKPRLLKDKITKVGTICFILGIRCMASIVFTLYSGINAPDLLITYFSLNVTFFFEMLRFTAQNWRLDKVQESVLQIIKPSNLYDILATDLQKKNDQKQAAIIEEEFYRHLSLEDRIGVKKYLIESRLRELNEENGNRSKTILAVLFLLAIFFVSSLGEGLIQDLFLDPIKDFFCKAVKIYCK